VDKYDPIAACDAEIRRVVYEPARRVLRDHLEAIAGRYAEAFDERAVDGCADGGDLGFGASTGEVNANEGYGGT
jgi:hypothetical protein